MTTGISIFFIAVGAVLAFAVSASVSGINIATVGVILMIAGALGLLVDLIIYAPRRRSYSSTTVADPSYTSRRRVVEEQDVV